MSLLASIKQIRLTTPPHCRAKAVMLPTSPPPPMMLTFMMKFQSEGFAPRSAFASRLNAGQCRHDLISHGLHDFLHVRGVLGFAVGLLTMKSLRLGSELAVAAIKDAVAT